MDNYIYLDFNLIEHMKVFYCQNLKPGYSGIIIVAANSIDEAIEAAKNNEFSKQYFEDDTFFPREYWHEHPKLSASNVNPNILFVSISDKEPLDYIVFIPN